MISSKQKKQFKKIKAEKEAEQNKKRKLIEQVKEMNRKKHMLQAYFVDKEKDLNS